jgi:hypothetical protein
VVGLTCYPYDRFIKGGRRGHGRWKEYGSPTEKYNRTVDNYRNKMPLNDDVIKWFKKPKTWQGIAGIIVIVIVLALDFAYWAGAIKVEEIPTESVDGGSDGESDWTIMVVRELDETETIRAPNLGQEIPETYIYHDFTIDENATEAIINVTYVDGLSGPINQPDLDLYVYAPDGDLIGESTNPQPDESVKLSNNTLEKRGPGQYQAEVSLWYGFETTYQVTADVYYNVTVEP